MQNSIAPALQTGVKIALKIDALAKPAEAYASKAAAVIVRDFASEIAESRKRRLCSEWPYQCKRHDAKLNCPGASGRVKIALKIEALAKPAEAYASKARGSASEILSLKVADSSARTKFLQSFRCPSVDAPLFFRCLLHGFRCSSVDALLSFRCSAVVPPLSFCCSAVVLPWSFIGASV